jgi:hypothetical protein
MDYKILYSFQSALDPELLLIEVERNIDTKDKTEKCFWFFINTVEQTISRLEYVNMKKRGNTVVRIFTNAKLYLNGSIGMYEEHDRRAIYISIPKISEIVNSLIDIYFN